MQDWFTRNSHHDRELSEARARLESGLDCLMCAIFARQRGTRTVVVVRQWLAHAHQHHIAQPLPLQRQLVVEPLHLIVGLRV